MRLFALVVFLALSACTAKVLEPQVGSQQLYRIGVADELKITVFGEEALSGTYKVDGQGVVRYPLIGTISAAGKTIPEFQSDLSGRLSQGYLTNPNVTIELAAGRPVYVLGEVARPGVYPYSESMTVFQAVAAAGGFSYRANRSRVLILHFGARKENRYVLRPDTPVSPGDTIRIGERYF